MGGEAQTPSPGERRKGEGRHDYFKDSGDLKERDHLRGAAASPRVTEARRFDSRALGHARSAHVGSVPNRSGGGARASEAFPPLDTRAGKAYTIVIDPGHGGKDPGAVSPDGRLKEKDVTLRIAHHLRRILNVTHPDIRVVLTRESDKTVSLKERAVLARSRKGDLFVSIHCNADVEASSHGIETYYFHKADSKKALDAAARENNVPVSMVNELQAALADVETVAVKPQSERLARTVHRNVISRLRPVITSGEDRGVRTAPFSVLAEVGMPAILVECAFVSNDRDRARLLRSGYHRLLAEGLAQGTTQYLRGEDPKLTLKR
ncbi:MAG: N-acetylmuramoyl-L-alanine amidase [Thermodesulfobacteriota bacterium]